jgi:TolA-binding protein
MRGIPAQHGLKKGLFLAFALAAGLSLGACTALDNLFGGDETEMAEPAPSAAPPDAGAPPTAGPAAPLPTTAGAAPVATITPVTIESGPDTGTAVNKTIQSLRAQVAGLQQRLSANSGRVAELRNQGAGAAGAYQEAKAHITTRLQVGTTRGNPELVAEWNTAQSQLDALSANLNALNGVGTDVTNDSSTAHFALDQISATFNVSGAVDEDHRQLQLLEDETSQTIVMIDRLLKEVSDTIQRQTAYIASERANLTTLAAAIKNGDFYGGSVTSGLGSVGPQSAAAGTPLVVVRFDRPNVDYQQILYAALNQALQNRPSASFQVVAVAPTRGNAASVQIAQSTARRHAEAVMRSMTDMGVPATRVGVASTTDPSATVSEVRVFVR